MIGKNYHHKERETRYLGDLDIQNHPTLFRQPQKILRDYYREPLAHREIHHSVPTLSRYSIENL